MSNLEPAVQPSYVPEPGTTAPVAYISPAEALANLNSRYSWLPNLSTVVFSEGLLLAASQGLDLLAPFSGVKVDPLQERCFPRTYKFGYPVALGMDAFMYGIAESGGVSLLHYDSIIPPQVVDWVCLEAYRMTQLEFLRGVARESMNGTSVVYDADSQIDLIMFNLIRPFLNMQGAQSAFPAVGV